MSAFEEGKRTIVGALRESDPVALERALSSWDFEEMKAAIAQYTPDFAERESGVLAETIRRLAIEFAEAAPACCTI